MGSLDGEIEVAACNIISGDGKCDEEESCRKRAAAAAADAKEGTTVMEEGAAGILCRGSFLVV